MKLWGDECCHCHFILFFCLLLHVCLVDVDECQSNQHRCHLCVNLPGSYRCECQLGYQYDSFRRMCVGMFDIIHNIMHAQFEEKPNGALYLLPLAPFLPLGFLLILFSPSPFLLPFITFLTLFALLCSRPSSPSTYCAARVYYSAVGELLLFPQLCCWLLQ